jgi:hypothetical protein
MLKGEIEKINLKKNLKKDQIQPGLIPWTCDMGHEVGLNHKSQT